MLIMYSIMDYYFPLLRASNVQTSLLITKIKIIIICQSILTIKDPVNLPKHSDQTIKASRSNKLIFSSYYIHNGCPNTGVGVCNSESQIGKSELEMH